MSRALYLYPILGIFILITMAGSIQATEESEKQGKNSKKADYIAIVNGKKISRDSLDRKVDLVRNKYAGMGQPLEGEQLDSLRKNILNNMIEKQLLYEESQEQDIDVKSTLIDKELNEIKSKFPNQEEFERTMKEMEYSEEILRKEIQENLAIQALIEKQIANRIKVNSDEISNYYESNKDKFSEPEQVHARHILIKAAPEASDARKMEARKEIEKIQARLKEGDDFAKLAEDYSEGPSSENGGDLGYFRRGQMVEAFDKAAFAMEPGQISNIVETRFGYHLIKVEDHKTRTRKPLEEVKGMIQEELKRKQVIDKLKPYIESLKQKYPVERNLPAS